MCTEYWFQNYLVKLAQEINLVRLNGRLYMTIAVDWDVKPQTKQLRKYEHPQSKKESSRYELCV